jgi:hypothetical protein
MEKEIIKLYDNNNSSITIKNHNHPEYKLNY